jgi:hypothetical protein
MKVSDIFLKTSRGLSEIGTRTSTLSVQQRRVLILVNGENDAATLKELSLCDNIVKILDTLLRLGLIERVGVVQPMITPLVQARHNSCDKCKGFQVQYATALCLSRQD